MKYIFMHIGKTAGTSFRYFLQKNITGCYYGYDVLPELPLEPGAITEALIAKAAPLFAHYTCFCAHMAYGLHQYMHRDSPYRYLTLLREPVARTLSTYRYGIQRGWTSPDTDIVHWLRNESDYRHYQIGYLTGPVSDSLSEQGRITLAMEHLRDENMLFGFSERYAEYIQLCCDHLEEDLQPVHVSINSTTVNQTITPRQREAVTDLLQGEIAFYHQARELYHNKHPHLPA